MNRLREGRHTPTDIQLLQTRILTKDDPRYDVMHRHLTYSNVRKDTHNDYAFKHTATEAMRFEAKDSPKCNMSKKEAQKLLSAALSLPVKDTAKLMQTLDLKPSLPVEVSVNGETDDGLTNGQFGIFPAKQTGSSVSFVQKRRHTCGWSSEKNALGGRLV